MRTNDRYLWLIGMVALVALLGACGGAAEPEEMPAEETAPAPESAGIPEPPPEEDLVIDPSGLAIGGPVTGSASVTANTLTPLAFGTATLNPTTQQYNFSLVVNGNPVPGVTTVTITNQNNASDKLTLSVGTGGTVSWDHNGTAVTAYTPSSYGDDCSLMASDLAPFFVSGNSFTFNNGNVSTPLTGTNAIELTLVPDDTTQYQECP